MADPPAPADCTCVIDASALLATIHGEPGGELVEGLLEGSCISAVNWSEVVQRAVEDKVPTEGLRTDVEDAGVTIVPFLAEDAERAAELWPRTRNAGLALADRACLALAARLGVPAVTADRSWSEVAAGVEIHTIR